MPELMYTVRNKIDATGPVLPNLIVAFGEDLESALSYLADEAPWLSDSERLRNRAWFADASRVIAESVGAAQRHTVQQPEPTWLRPLIEHWISTTSTVITFNYDVLVEAATYGLFGTGGNWSSLYRAPVVPAALRLSGIWGAAELASMSLLKLHGSLTWFWSGIDSDRNDVIYDVGLLTGWSHEGLSSPYEQTLPKLTSDKVPMVVPPTASKSKFYENAVLSSQWKLAADAIREAEELVFIGYSIPKSDLITRSLLLTNFGGKRVVPVDVSSNVLANLNDLWGNWDIEIATDYIIPEEPVSRFVSAEAISQR
jgi:hypothetical protein